MTYRYHIQTPFSRFKNLGFYLRRLEPLGVNWHPIFDSSQRDLVPKLPGWVRPLYCPAVPNKWFAGNYKSNYFARNGEYGDQDRIILINDDDWIGEGFLDKIDAVGGDFLICGMKRGDNVAASNYPTFTLEAKPENLAHGSIGGEQIIISGSLQRKYRWCSTRAGDWLLIAELLAEWKPVFVPEAYALFNYLEPGRWNEVVCP